MNIGNRRLLLPSLSTAKRVANDVNENATHVKSAVVQRFCKAYSLELQCMTTLLDFFKKHQQAHNFTLTAS